MSFANYGVLTLISMRYLLMAVGLSTILASCSKKGINNDLTGTTDSLPAISFLDVAYGVAPLQKADVYLPALRNAKTKTLVIIHGGGWTAGDKSDYNGYVSEFQNKLPDYAIVNVNYRLVTYDSTYFPMEESDILSAIQFVLNKASDYHISKDIILLGASAGAHLALLQGYKHSDVLQPKGIISFFGPTDLSDLFVHYKDNTIPWVLQKIMGGTLQETPEAFMEASPINYVSSTSAPTLMLHGDADPLVPVAQAQALQTKLNSLHVANKLVIYPGEGHGWTGPDLTDSFQKVEDFIRGL